VKASPALRALSLTAVLLAACGNAEYQREQYDEWQRETDERGEESFFDLFRNQTDPERGVVVNRFLWQASLDTLSFLPLETADPFSGVIVTGWGQVAGSGPYRATILISDPALDARSLKVAAFRQQGGRAVPVGEAENSQLEDAILTRARQMRIAETGRR
jgi:hypothetical protein